MSLDRSDQYTEGEYKHVEGFSKSITSFMSLLKSGSYFLIRYIFAKSLSRLQHREWEWSSIHKAKQTKARFRSSQPDTENFQVLSGFAGGANNLRHVMRKQSSHALWRVVLRLIFCFRHGRFTIKSKPKFPTRITNERSCDSFVKMLLQCEMEQTPIFLR